MIQLRSRPRRDLLVYYFTNPGAQHYLRELARLLAVDAANLSRELGRLEREGLFISERRGRQKYYRLNRKYPLHEELRRIIFKTVGVLGQLRRALQRVASTREAYLYGSFARDQQDTASDIDLLIIGRPEATQLEDAIRRLERRLGRQINYTLFSPEEFKARRARKDPFLEDVWKQKRITVVPAA